MENTVLFKHILYKPATGRGFRYSPLMVNLLHKVSGVSADIIRHTKIYPRSYFRYIPFYPAHRGGGAITLGNHKWQSITFTENFFSDDQTQFNNKAYANDIYSWLRMSAHEVGHLEHAQRFRSFIVYLIVFAYQYLKHGHDAAPLEIEADQGTHQLHDFMNYLRTIGRPNGLSELITAKDDEATKQAELEELWYSYQLHKLV